MFETEMFFFQLQHQLLFSGRPVRAAQFTSQMMIRMSTLTHSHRAHPSKKTQPTWSTIEYRQLLEMVRARALTIDQPMRGVNHRTLSMMMYKKEMSQEMT